jgi:hypothetical protein
MPQTLSAGAVRPGQTLLWLQDHSFAVFILLIRTIRHHYGLIIRLQVHHYTPQVLSAGAVRPGRTLLWLQDHFFAALTLLIRTIRYHYELIIRLQVHYHTPQAPHASTVQPGWTPFCLQCHFTIWPNVIMIAITSQHDHYIDRLQQYMSPYCILQTLGPSAVRPGPTMLPLQDCFTTVSMKTTMAIACQYGHNIDRLHTTCPLLCS